MRNIFIIVIVLIIIFGVAFWLMQKPAVAPKIETEATPTATPNETGSAVSPSPSANNAPTTEPSVSATAAVKISGFAFNPASLKIKPGTKVVWTNNDSVSHTVTGNSGEINSPPLALGDSFNFTFTQTGTYQYHCSIHPSMRGTVEVTK